MKKTIILSVLSFFIFSCNHKSKRIKPNQKITQETNTFLDIDSLHIKEKRQNKESNRTLLDSTSILLQSLEQKMYAQYKHTNQKVIKIYSSRSYRYKKDGIINMIPLTDSYPWSNHKDSIVIAEQYLKEFNKKGRNYHKLFSKHRRLFLQRMQVSEKDSIFIYDLSDDKILTYSISNLSLIAILSPYEFESPLDQSKFIIGFDLNQEIRKNINPERVFAYIGKENPFLKGNLKFIYWNKIGMFTFDSKKYTLDDLYLKKDVIREMYHFSTDSLDYFMLKLGIKESDHKHMRHLLVFDKHSKKLITDILSDDREGRSHTRMVISGEEQNAIPEQITGKLFKDQPPVVFGLLSHSFGCSKINFIDQKKSYIRLLCDNRH